ncbi:hypothetical protein ACFV61_35595, partial [Kitasatospora sp. NPDC059817]
GWSAPPPAPPPDAARAEPGSPLRTAFTAGLRDLADGFQHLPDAAERESALADLSTMVGALLLARASEDPALSDELLAAARHRLTTPTAPAGPAVAPRGSAAPGPRRGAAGPGPGLTNSLRPPGGPPPRPEPEDPP